MKTAYFWEQDQCFRHRDTLCIYRVITPRGKVGLAMLCAVKNQFYQEGRAIHEQTGELCEDIICWFYHDLMELVKKGRSRNCIKNSCLRAISHSFSMIEERTGFGRNKFSLVLLLSIGKRLILIKQGEGTILITKYHRNRVLFKRFNNNEITVLYQSWKQDTKVIMAGFPVNRFLTKEERNAVVNGKTFAKMQKNEKILKEVGMRAKIRGCKTSISMIGLLEE